MKKRVIIFAICFTMIALQVNTGVMAEEIGAVTTDADAADRETDEKEAADLGETDKNTVSSDLESGSNNQGTVDNSDSDVNDQSTSVSDSEDSDMDSSETDEKDTDDEKTSLREELRKHSEEEQDDYEEYWEEDEEYLELEEESEEEYDEEDDQDDIYEIIGFEELGNKNVIISGSNKPSLDDLLLDFPDTIAVVVANQSETTTMNISVSWHCVDDDYEESTDHYFQFVPRWNRSKYPLSADIDEESDIPYISVTVKDSSKKQNVDYELIKWATAYDESSMEEDKEMVFNYLVGKLGLSNAAASGIMANIQYESGFSNTAIGDGGTSYGLCQWHAERFTRLRKYCGSRGIDYRTTEGQLIYLEYELVKSYPDVLEYLKKVENTKTGAYDAAYYWCVNFEKPANMEKKGVLRGNLAKNNLWKIYKDRFVVFNIDYELDEGMNDAANPIAYSNLTEAISLIDPYREGYSFEGWYLEPEYENEITEIVSELAGSITLYAKWAPVEEDLGIIYTDAEYDSIAEYVFDESIGTEDSILGIALGLNRIE